MKMERGLAILGCMTLLVACAGFSYTYYGVGPDAAGELKGMILGKTEAEDMPLSKCMPDDQQKGKCVLVFVDEFERIRADMLALQEQLKACQQGH